LKKKKKKTQKGKKIFEEKEKQREERVIDRSLLRAVAVIVHRTSLSSNFLQRDLAEIVNYPYGTLLRE
jgi:hypothetical protein